MRRIVIIAASMAGVFCATRLKRRLPEDEVNLILPANLEDLHAFTGPVGKRIAQKLPNLELLTTRNLGVLDASNIMTDLEKKEITLSSSRGSLPVRYTDLVVEVQASPRIPRAIQSATNVFTWPAEGFFAQASACDTAIANAIQEGKTITIVGSGMVALDAVLLILEAGAKVHWLAPETHDEPWVDDHLWQYLYTKLAGQLTYTILPDSSVANLTCVTNEAQQLTLLVDKDHNEHSVHTCFWTTPLIARHPLLREDGVTLDANGRITIEKDLHPNVSVIGSGVAIPSATFGSSGICAPKYIGGEQAAYATAANVANTLASTQQNFEGVYGARKATGNGVAVYRAGYTSTEALRAGLQTEIATIAMPISHTDEATVTMSVLCHKETQTIIGLQVLGLHAHEAIVEGVFDTAFTALASGSSLLSLTTRESVGLPSQILSRCASILINKCTGTVKSITPAELLASAAAGAEFFILDLRAQPEWEKRRLKDAYNIPLPQLKKRLQDEVPRFTPLVLVCETANDSYTVGCKLVGLGASEIYILDGGMNLWPYETHSK